MVSAASGPYQHPSDLLAKIAFKLHCMTPLGIDSEQAIMANADETRERYQRAWDLEPEELFAQGGLVEVIADIESASAAMLADAVVILDIWHHFVIEMPDGILPEAAIVVQTDFEQRQHYNRDAEDGQLIPSQCMNIADPDRDRSPAIEAFASAFARMPETKKSQYDEIHDAQPGLVARLLRNITWLPPQLPCEHADDRDKRGEPIVPIYRRIIEGSAALYQREALRIAVAPLAETAACAEFRPTNSGASYTIYQCYGLDRVKAAVDNALTQNADLLLLPEMTVAEQHLPDLARYLREASRAKRHAGPRPRLHFVLVGASRSATKDRPGANFLAILDTRGELIKTMPRQDKISRWNLKAGEQKRFGLHRVHKGMHAPIKEDIDQAKHVVVFDIAGFGRMICLICASMNHNEPSDWLIHNTQPDWVYAPVMDSSTCWTNCNDSPLEKWTVLRAYRAACLSRGRVIVSNSMTFQDLENKENCIETEVGGKPKTAKYSGIEDPGIFLAIDHRSGKALYTIIPAPIPTKPPAPNEIFTNTFEWNEENLKDFDTELAEFLPTPRPPS